MAFWILLALLTAGALFLLLRPLAARGPAEADRSGIDVAVYREQLDEIERDLSAGVIAEAEARDARLEVQRRLLAAARPSGPVVPTAPGRGGFVAGVVIAAVVPVSALGLYLALGSPQMPDEPLSARAAERSLLASDGSLDLVKARAALASKLAKDPASVEGWLLLGRTDVALGHWPDAKADLEHALDLSNRRADVLEAYGQVLVGEASGKLAPDALSLFEEAVKKDSHSYLARYELAVAKARRSDFSGAVADFTALERDAPPDAEWLSTVKDAIAALQTRGAPVPAEAAGKPRAEVADIMKLDPGERVNAIRGMVAGLAARLQQDPSDIAGWKRLGRSYLVLGEPAKAADAYAEGANHAPDDLDLAVGRAQALQAMAGADEKPSPDVAAAYSRVLAISPDQPDALWYLGLAAHRSGDDAKAAEFWRRLLAQLKPGSAEAENVEKQLAALKPS